MLISLSKKFVFVANLKTASTSIENALGHYCQIAITESRYGKHMTLQDIERNFQWLSDFINTNDFEVFGFIRDPISYYLSLYNSHSDPMFQNNGNLFTGDCTFSEFLSSWTSQNPEQVIAQCERFIPQTNLFGQIRVFPFEDIDIGLQYIAQYLGIAPIQLGKHNCSPKKLRNDDLSPDQIREIQSRAKIDIEFIKRLALA